MAIQQDLIKVGNLEWFYRESNPVGESDKLPVVLLHGFPSQSHCWTEVMPILTQNGFRCIAPDWVGFGLSSKPEKRDFAYTPDAFIEALGGFVKALEVDKFHLVVQGFLGSVGLQYALRYPEQVGRLAILNAPVFKEAKVPFRIQQLGLPFVGDMVTQDPLSVERILEAGCRLPISDQDLDIYRRPFLKTSAAGRSLLYTVRNLQLNQAMAEVESGFAGWSHPTLVMWGMTDPWLSFEGAEKFAGILQTKEVVKLPESAHYPQEHWSEDVGNGITTFLRRSEV
ncbi:alpha/beta fold hydrolase [Ancylothrix sp. C2]|uniref:alpha/beta fold hydrolase n=1 Tax=Ancylothrix sp. D3o TaxID=2953691 RepID=UPI0021BB2224|nr:alpha/beta fold hydrolase [Ancylothrix sp. D3o]MCT7949422.1 alpha/beta fold hydrolase [Ancylothrix sp. D3o]